MAYVRRGAAGVRFAYSTAFLETLGVTERGRSRKMFARRTTDAIPSGAATTLAAVAPCLVANAVPSIPQPRIIANDAAVYLASSDRKRFCDTIIQSPKSVPRTWISPYFRLCAPMACLAAARQKQ